MHPDKVISFIHTADIHFGMENYGKIDPQTGIHTRLLDFEKALNFCIDIAIEKKVDFFLFCLWLILTFGHYTVLIVCLTCTPKLTRVSDKIFLPLRSPLYLKLKQASKSIKLLTFITHFMHTIYLMHFL